MDETWKSRKWTAYQYNGPDRPDLEVPCKTGDWLVYDASLDPYRRISYPLTFIVPLENSPE